MRKRTSPIWKISKEDLVELVDDSKTIGEVLGFFGMKNVGCNYKTLKAKCLEDEIDYSKFSKNYGKWFPKKSIPASEILIKGPYRGSNALKKRLFKEGILENKCYECGQLPVWNGKPLSLELDHINGDNTDNRIENLQILCGHCHSQTDTFRGKKLRIKRNCSQCGKKIIKGSKLCSTCNNKRPKPETRKVERPNKEELEKMVWEKPANQIAKQFGVSGNSIKKWCKSYGIDKPGRGFWAKEYAKNNKIA